MDENVKGEKLTYRSLASNLERTPVLAPRVHRGLVDLLRPPELANNVVRPP